MLLTRICGKQVEVSGGRGKPSMIVDKDDGLDKVNNWVVSLLNMIQLYLLVPVKCKVV